MIIDVNSPLVGEAITSFQPWTSYYAAYLNHTFAVVEAFSGYPNTLLFFSGNEVINDLASAKDVPPYLRAVTRDLKTYIKNNIDRPIPVGYSAADVRQVLWDTWNYMHCNLHDDDMSSVDVFALNSYSWCGPAATYSSSTFMELTEGFAIADRPVFFSEYGCNTPAPRYWNETMAIYGDKMAPLFSGGVVYEWTEEENKYGLVSVKDNVLTIMDDYTRLKDRWASIDWPKLQSQDYEIRHNYPPVCSQRVIMEPGFNSNFTLPSPPPGAQALIDNGISPKPRGKIVKIDDYNVKMVVKGSDGNVISGLKVVPLADDEFNWLGRNKVETGPPAGTGQDGNGGGSSKKNAAGNLRPAASMASAALLVAMALA